MLLAASIGLALMLSPQAFAQVATAAPETATTETAVPAPQKGEATTLDGLTVTAQRREEKIKDVPLTVNALSAKSLKESGVASIFDLTSAVSGLSMGGAGNQTQPSIRGVSTTLANGGSENASSLYVDGVFYSLPHLLGSTLPDVERVEVLKGPQGTLFGRNSVAGAIRIFTRNPSFETTGDFSSELGWYTGGNGSRSSPHYVAQGFFSAPLVDDKLAFSVSLAHDYTPGWMTEQVSGRRYAPVQRDNARVKLLFQPSDTFNVLLNGYYLKHDDRGVQAMTPYKGLVASSAFPGSVVSTEKYHTTYDVGPNRDGNIVNWDTAEVQSKGISATAEWTLNAGTLTSITNHNRDEILNYTTIHQSRGSDLCLIYFACVNLNRPGFQKASSQELNFASEQFGRYRFTGGLFYFDQKYRMDMSANDTVYPGGIPSSYIRHNLKSTAGYGELQFDAADRLTAIVGARYTYEQRRDRQLAPDDIKREENFNSFLPRVSVMYKLSDATNVYATYSKGYASGLTGVTNAGNGYKPVAPEENTAYEVGLKYGTNNAVINIAAFYYDYQDKQEQAWDGISILTMNTGPVRIFGVEGDASVRLGQGFTLRGNISWLPQAEYRDFKDAAGFSTDRNAAGGFEQVIFNATGYRLQRAPELSGAFTLAYNKPWMEGHLDASATLTYSSKVYHDIYHVLEQGAYSTLGMQVGYSFYNNLRIGLYGRNLTNEAYMFHGFASGVGFTANYAKPREIGATVSYAF